MSPLILHRFRLHCCSPPPSPLQSSYLHRCSAPKWPLVVLEVVAPAPLRSRCSKLAGENNFSDSLLAFVWCLTRLVPAWFLSGLLQLKSSRGVGEIEIVGQVCLVWCCSFSTHLLRLSSLRKLNRVWLFAPVVFWIAVNIREIEREKESWLILSGLNSCHNWLCHTYCGVMLCKVTDNIHPC